MIIYKKLFNDDEFNNLIISIRLPQVYLSNTDGIDDIDGKMINGGLELHTIIRYTQDNICKFFIFQILGIGFSISRQKGF